MSRARPAGLEVEALEDRTVPSLALPNYLSSAFPTNGVAVGDVTKDSHPDGIVASGSINPGNGPVTSPSRSPLP
jgi:hypothetical protein